MKMSTRFSDAIHILAFIVIYKEKVQLSSDTIASSIGTSPVVVRRLMAQLKKGGLLTAVPGFADPTLKKPAEVVTLLDVYLTIEGEKPLFSVHPKTNPACVVGGNIQPTLTEYYRQAEVAAKAKLQQTTLQDLIDTILVRQAEKEASK